LTSSIANGLAFAIAVYGPLKLPRGGSGRTDWLLLVLAGLFVARFVWLSAG
jgi:AGZA family xanthine/uracil permease-like MFS transporter